MMTSAPAEKSLFHFSGDGVYHNLVIWAHSLEEASKEWLATRKLINSPAMETTSTAAIPPTVQTADEKDTDLQK